MIHGFIRPRLVRLGKIHLGEKAISPNSGKEYPKDLEHFRVPPEVAEVYGETPQALDVRVPSANIEQWFPYSLKRYSRDGKLWCRGDGQVARCFEEASGEWVERPCLYKDCEYYQVRQTDAGPRPPSCTEIGTLQVILPTVDMRGVYQIATGSWNGINNVYQEFTTFLDIMRAVIGPIADQAILRVAFQLTREPTTVEYVGEDGKRRSREKWLMHLRPPRFNLDDLNNLARSCTTPVSGFLAPGPETEVVGEAEDRDGDDVVIDGAVVPEPDETMPADLYPGASPTGPDMGQRSVWAALLEQVQSLGKNIAVVEKSALGMASKDAKALTDLTGEEATQAIDALTRMIEAWQTEPAKAALTDAAAPAEGTGTGSAPATTAAPKRTRAKTNAGAGGMF